MFDGHQKILGSTNGVSNVFESEQTREPPMIDRFPQLKKCLCGASINRTVFGSNAMNSPCLACNADQPLSILWQMSNSSCTVRSCGIMCHVPPSKVYSQLSLHPQLLKGIDLLPEGSSVFFTRKWHLHRKQQGPPLNSVVSVVSCLFIQFLASESPNFPVQMESYSPPPRYEIPVTTE